MSPTDLARLEVAKRAYQATQPRDAEVQTGVRRARLWLGRPKPRRNWFSKGLVLVVLALGSLAYAKPQALGALVQQALQPTPPLPQKRGGKTGAEAAQLASVAPAAEAPRLAPVTPVATGVASEPAAAAKVEPVAADARINEVEAVAEQPNRKPAPRAAARNDVARREPAASAASESVSDWGRVGQALAHGDDAGALSALEQLSKSDEQSTRDKADLGRAQLFMAHGQSSEGCALGRSLVQRGAGASIERQAQVLLKSCAH